MVVWAEHSQPARCDASNGSTRVVVAWGALDRSEHLRFREHATQGERAPRASAAARAT